MQTKGKRERTAKKRERTASKRELNQQTAAVLAEVVEGIDVMVTERGRPRWRISAVTQADSALARLEREGRYTAPQTEPTPWATDADAPAYTSDQVDALIDELRGDH